MNPDTKKRIERYEAVKLEIKKLEFEAETLADALLSEIPSDATIEAHHGTLSVSSRSQWTYSEKTQEAEKQLKAKQKEERQLGVAVEQPGKPFLIYKANE